MKTIPLEKAYEMATKGPLSFTKEEIRPEEFAYRLRADEQGDKPSLLGNIYSEPNATFLAHAYNVLPEAVNAMELALSALNVAFEHEGDVFGVHHNDAVDAISLLNAALTKASQVQISVD